MAERFNGLEQFASRTEQLFAFGRQFETAFAATAQPVAETGFELGHLLADARLAETEFTLGGAETAALHHADKQAQQMEVQIVNLSEHQTLLPVKVRIINLIFF